MDIFILAILLGVLLTLLLLGLCVAVLVVPIVRGIARIEEQYYARQRAEYERQEWERFHATDQNSLLRPSAETPADTTLLRPVEADAHRDAAPSQLLRAALASPQNDEQESKASPS